MWPFLIANMVNLAIRLSVALICAPRFGIAFVWLGVPAVSYTHLDVYKRQPLYNETLRGCFTVGEKKKYQKIDN